MPRPTYAYLPPTHMPTCNRHSPPCCVSVSSAGKKHPLQVAKALLGEAKVLTTPKEREQHGLWKTLALTIQLARDATTNTDVQRRRRHTRAYKRGVQTSNKEVSSQLVRDCFPSVLRASVIIIFVCVLPLCVREFVCQTRRACT